MTPEIRLVEVLFKPITGSCFNFADAILDSAYTKISLDHKSSER